MASGLRSEHTTDWDVTSSKGLSVDYTSVVDDRGTIFDISDDTTELTGPAVLPGGITQTFSVVTAGGITEVQAEQSDGSVFTLSVPLASPMFMHPDPSQNTVGRFTDPGFGMDFVLASTPKYPARWAALLSSVARPRLTSRGPTAPWTTEHLTPARSSCAGAE